MLSLNTVISALPAGPQFPTSGWGQGPGSVRKLTLLRTFPWAEQDLHMVLILIQMLAEAPHFAHFTERVLRVTEMKATQYQGSEVQVPPAEQTSLTCCF